MCVIIAETLFRAGFGARGGWLVVDSQERGALLYAPMDLITGANGTPRHRCTKKRN